MNEVSASVSPTATLRRGEIKLDVCADALLLFMLFLAPLLLASNRPVFWALNGAFATVILLWLSLRLWASPPRFEGVSLALFLTAFAIVLLLAWMAIQASGSTPQSWRHPLWEIVPEAHGAISIEPSLTLSTIGWTATLSVMLVAIAKSSDARFVRRFMRLAAGIAAAVALFGMVVEAADLPTLGIAPKTAYLGWLTGTFVNRNSAATFFGFGMIAALVLVVIPDAEVSRCSHRRRALFRFLFSRRDAALRWLLVSTFLLVAVVMTGSRGGFASVLVGLVIFVAIWFIKFRQLRSVSAPALLVAATICIVAVTILANAVTFDRPDATSSNEARISLYREAIKAIGDRPFAGHGAGAYAAVQPMYQSISTLPQFVWNRAHSTYLEAAVTLGLPATALLLVFSALVLVWITRALARSKQPNPALIAALPVAGIAAVHSLVDFSLQMQAVALYFVTFAGLAIGAAALTRRAARKKANLSPSSTPREGVRDQSASTGRRPASLLPRAAALLTCMLAVVALAANLRIAAVESAVPSSLWLASLRPYAPQPFRPRLQLPDWTRDRNWGDPYALYIQAEDCQLLEAVAPEFGLHTPERIRSCLADIDGALRLAPAAGALWLKKATLLRDLEGASESFYSALQNSYKTARRSLPLKPARLALSLAYWEGLPSDLRREVADEAVAALETALETVAAEYIRYPDERDAIDKGMVELASRPMREAFAKAVTVQSDRLRRSVDRIEANRRLVSCRSDCNDTAELTLDIAGETFSEPPQFRVWLDGYPQPPMAVTSAADLEREARLTWADPLSLDAQSFVFEIPAKLAVLEIEFINDAWDQARGLDRNFGVLRVQIDSKNVPLSCFRISAGYEPNLIQSDTLLLFIRNGAVRLELPCAAGKA